MKWKTSLAIISTHGIQSRCSGFVVYTQMAPIESAIGGSTFGNYENAPPREVDGDLFIGLPGGETYSLQQTAVKRYFPSGTPSSWRRQPDGENVLQPERWSDVGQYPLVDQPVDSPRPHLNPFQAVAYSNGGPHPMRRQQETRRIENTDDSGSTTSDTSDFAMESKYSTATHSPRRLARGNSLTASATSMISRRGNGSSGSSFSSSSSGRYSRNGSQISSSGRSMASQAYAERTAQQGRPQLLRGRPIG